MGIALFIAIGVLLLIALTVGIWTLVAYGILMGLQALGVIESVSWTAALGIGLLMVFVSGLFGRNRAQRT